MASMHGFMDGTYDYRQMYARQDVRGPLPVPAIYRNTILGTIAANPDTSEFMQLLEKTQLVGVMNDPGFKHTVLVPLNGTLPRAVFDLDAYTVRRIVLQHMLPQSTPYEFLRGSKGMMVNTRVPGVSIFVQCLDGEHVKLNRLTNIVGRGPMNLYYIDRMLCLDPNPESNL